MGQEGWKFHSVNLGVRGVNKNIRAKAMSSSGTLSWNSGIPLKHCLLAEFRRDRPALEQNGHDQRLGLSSGEVLEDASCRRERCRGGAGRDAEHNRQSLERGVAEPKVAADERGAQGERSRPTGGALQHAGGRHARRRFRPFSLPRASGFFSSGCRHVDSVAEE